jgi:KH domain
MHKDAQFSNSNRDHDAAPITTAEHCEHSTLMPQNTVPESEVYNASATGLNTVLAEATSAFAAVDSASGALLAITALLVNWQDKAAMPSVQTVCFVLRDTIALLRGAITITTIAPAEALQATLCAARAAFDELDAICEALLSMIALLTDWKDSAIDCTRRRMIAITRATIALLSNSVCATSSCDGVSDVVETSARLRTVSAVTAAVQVSCDVAAAAVTRSKVPSMNTRAASNSTADAATAHTRDVSTQTNEGYTSYEQLQQQVSALTAQLKKHGADCDSAAIVKGTRHQSYDLWAHESMCSTQTTATEDSAAAAVSTAQRHTDDMQVRYELERLLTADYSIACSAKQTQDFSGYSPSKVAVSPSFDGYGTLAQQHGHEQHQQAERSPVVMQISDSEAGALLGIRGERLKAIKQQYGVKIDVDGSKGDAVRQVNIRATTARSDLAAAAQAVRGCIAMYLYAAMPLNSSYEASRRDAV